MILLLLLHIIFRRIYYLSADNRVSTLKLSDISLKVLHQSSVLIVDLQAMFHRELADVSMICHCVLFQLLSSTGLSAIAMKPKAKDNFRTAVIKLCGKLREDIA